MVPYRPPRYYADTMLLSSLLVSLLWWRAWGHNTRRRLRKVLQCRRRRQYSSSGLSVLLSPFFLLLLSTLQPLCCAVSLLVVLVLHPSNVRASRPPPLFCSYGTDRPTTHNNTSSMHPPSVSVAHSSSILRTIPPSFHPSIHFLLHPSSVWL